MSKQIRLLKVLVQPVFVVDDGDTLTEQATNPVEVSAVDWPTFATGPFVQGMEELQARLDAVQPLQGDPGPDTSPPA